MAARTDLPEPGEIWRRKSNGNLVRVTELRSSYGSFDVYFEAFDRKPRQPAKGRKWLAGFLKDLERADQDKEKN